MTQEEKRMRIAEACRWTYNEVIREWVAPYKAPIAGDKTTYGLPNYFNDLNAMHEAEKVLKVEQHFTFQVELARVINTITYPLNFALLHATASQRAEAFGLTLNLWKQDE